jgi:hypothetical protein
LFEVVVSLFNDDVFEDADDVDIVDEVVVEFAVLTLVLTPGF